MATQSGENRLGQPSCSPSHSARTGNAALLVVATCLLAALVTFGLLAGQRAPTGAGGSPAGADDNAAWTVGP